MTIDLQSIKDRLAVAFAAQVEATDAWHEVEPAEVVCGTSADLDTLGSLILMQHLRNFRLWHIEDSARRRDVDDSVIASCKRSIDTLNQERNDYIEKVDGCLAGILSPLLPEPKGDRQRRNTETPGMAIDRLSILALKVFHMDEQTRRDDVDDAHRRSCEEKLAVLLAQRSSLAAALFDLLDEYAEGRKTPAVYYQFKMYNDPSLNPELYGKK